MYKIGLAITIAIVSLCACKQDSTAKLPDFNILLSDSATVVKTKDIPEGGPIVLIHFSADCSDCQQETEEILKNMDSLKQARFYFFTIENMERLDVFIQHYKLKNYPNIVCGADTARFFRKHFNNYTTPFIAIYKGNKDLAGVIQGKVPVSKIIKHINDIK